MLGMHMFPRISAMYYSPVLPLWCRMSHRTHLGLANLGIEQLYSGPSVLSRAALWALSFQTIQVEAGLRGQCLNCLGCIGARALYLLGWSEMLLIKNISPWGGGVWDCFLLYRNSNFWVHSVLYSKLIRVKTEEVSCVTKYYCSHDFLQHLAL